ncbi:hypothetical protein Tco_0866390 [Tanacetum coccineum]
MDSLDLDGENRERTRMRGTYYPIPCSILSIGKDRKTPQRYPDVPTTSWRISIRSIDSRTIDQSASGKLCDLNSKESWALLEDLTLYDNEIWNDPRDFAKPVKAIALPQDVPSTSDRHLIELENQVQRLMEAHLALTQPTQVNKITTSCEICSGPHDTQYFMENPEQAFVEYASLRTNEAGGLMFNFMASQDARLSKFEADFKQQQSEMTNKINTVLKAITNRIAGTLPSDTVKNPKLRTHPVSSARSYPTMDLTKENKEEERDSPENHPDSPTPPDLSVSFITKKVLKFNSLFESLGLVPPSPNAELVCTNENDEVAYKMPYMIEQYNSLSNLEKERTKLVYLRNEEDKRRGVDYVMNKILGFYKECLELGPEYVTGMDDEEEVT